MMNLRICHMIPGFFPIAKGGAEMFALNLCKALQRHGHVVQILTRNLDLPYNDSYEGVQIHRFKNILPYQIKILGFGQFLKSKYLRILVAFFDVIGGILSLWKLQRKNQFHLMHASFIVPWGLIGLIVKKLIKIPLIITVHGPADFYEVPPVLSPVLRFILSRCDKAVTVSPKLRKDIIEKMGYLPLEVICNGIPQGSGASPGNLAILGKYRINTETFVILTAGRLVQRKNIDLLIRTLPKILEKIPEAKVVVLGSGIEAQELRKVVKELQLGASVIMPGWVSEAEKNALFNRANIFIQLSQREGLSLALLESKAAGVPAIIIGTNNSLEPVNHGITGLLLEPPVTSEKILEQTVFLYSNQELRQKMGENAKKEAELKYSLEKMVDNYIKVYFRALRKNRGYI